jgi:hypothetical protein
MCLFYPDKETHTIVEFCQELLELYLKGSLNILLKLKILKKYIA